MAESKERKQPPWEEPSRQNAFISGLKINNSMTSSKVDFIPHKGKRVGWYICGPTVYDQSHMGHARNYVTFDIIRRILEDYFGYEVFAVMNITDVDDKIILKARKNYLFDKYFQEHQFLTADVVNLVTKSWRDHEASLKKKLAEAEADKELKPAERLATVSLYTEKIQEAQKIQTEIDNAPKGDTVSATHILNISKEPLSVVLDGEQGKTITDQKIFRDLAAFYEKEFLEDMKTLGIRTPDVLTRVTEYIPDVITFVQKIVDNGYGYVSNGSVYFDTTEFTKTHPYGKLEPTAVGNQKLIQEGEGALSLGGEKKSPSDFAIWKKSKEGEPFWQSPWGNGRPGWHIECSAMAGDHLGATLDIHSGGEDLRFPHHDNELAQSEAYYNCKQWVNYFLHSGHLHINGLKMSKSLKNFISIRQALQDYTPRQLRLLFLMKPWDKVMNYVQDTMELEVKAKEKTLVEFFLFIKNLLREEEKWVISNNQHWTTQERELHEVYYNTQNAVDEHLKDSFNTPAALQELLDLINKTNVYVRSTKELKLFLVKKIGLFITKILKVFGLIENDSIGFAGKPIEAAIFPIVDTFLNFRKDVRDAAKKKAPYEHILDLLRKLIDETLPTVLKISDSKSDIKDLVLKKADASSAKPVFEVFFNFSDEIQNAVARKAAYHEFLDLTDKLRDEHLPTVGFILTDTEDKYLWDIVDPKELLREIAAKKAGILRANLKKLEAKFVKLDQDIKKMEGAALTFEQQFKAEYSQFKDGYPTHDAQGKELAPSAVKKVKKTVDAHQKAHLQYEEKEKKDPGFLTKLVAEREKLAAEITTIKEQLIDNNA